MNARLYALIAERLDGEQIKRDVAAFFGSIHGTLNHILLADRVWLLRFTRDVARFTSRDDTGAPIAIQSLAQVLYADFAELRRQREATDFEIEEWVGSLTDDQLAQPIEYKTSTGVSQSHPLWWAVSHFFNHQTHHRGQVTALLFQLGVDPGVTDLVAMLREAPSRVSTPG
jgi:uncharacterized damage-inducible protein DinB